MQGLIGTRRHRKKDEIIDMQALKQKAAESMITAAGIAGGIAAGFLISDEIKRSRSERQRMLDELYRTKKARGKKGKKGKNKQFRYYYR